MKAGSLCGGYRAREGIAQANDGGKGGGESERAGRGVREGRDEGGREKKRVSREGEGGK